MRIDVEVDTDAYIIALQKRGWAVGGMRTVELDTRIKLALQKFLQAQTEEHVEWYLDHIQDDLRLEKIHVAGEVVEPKESRARKPYKIVRVDGE